MNFKVTLAALLLLAACGGNPFPGDVDEDTDGDGVPDTVSEAVPEEVAVNLRAITYKPGNGGSLSVNMDGLVGSPLNVTFQRNEALDISGYRAFSYQETGTQRTHLALVRDNARGNLRALATADGGQFNRHFGGTYFARLDAFTRPAVGTGKEAGQFSYAGSYAGVFVSDGESTTPGLPGALAPTGNLRVRGDALINANFANDNVNGGVANRWLLDASGNRVDLNGDGRISAADKLADITFPETEINEVGGFLGDVEFSGAPGQAIGSVAGLFGGRAASDIAATLVINPIQGEQYIWEYGVMNIPRCGTTGATSPICSER